LDSDGEIPGFFGRDNDVKSVYAGTGGTIETYVLNVHARILFTPTFVYEETATRGSKTSFLSAERAPFATRRGK
jgi:hypothetical protein